MTGKSDVHPWILTGNVATESMYEDEAMRNTMEKYFEIANEFRKIKFGSKIDKAINAKMKGYEDMVLQKMIWNFIRLIMRRLALDLQK